MDAQNIYRYVRSTTRGGIREVFEVALWPRIREEAPLDSGRPCRLKPLAKPDVLVLQRERRELAPASQFKFMAFTYVYILQSEIAPEHFYTGLTNNLRKCLKRHNDGTVPHTSKRRPWRLKTYIAMADRLGAAELEKYLKSHSGRAFLKKHL